MTNKNVDSYLNILNELASELSKVEKDNINFKSMNNFLIHFNELDEREKSIVSNLLEDYFNEIKKEEYRLSVEQSRELFVKYIIKIGQYYNYHLGFKARLKIGAVLLVGIVCDFLLFITGVLKNVYFFPIVTSLLLFYHEYIVIFFEKKNKLYGPRY